MAVKTEHIIRFVAVAEHLSFTKAAHSLGVDQPWLSQQIRQLETQLGAPLFVRDTRGLRLTATGAQLLKEATALSEAAQAVEQAVQRIRRSHTEALRIGVPAFSYVLKEREDLVAEHQRRYPRVRFEFHGGYTPGLLEQVRSQQLDAAIVTAPFDDHDLDKIFLRRSYAALLVPKESELATGETLSVEDLRGHRLAALPRDLAPAAWEATYAALEKLGIEIVEVHEGHRGALYYYARRERLCVLTWQWGNEEETPADDMVHRLFSGWRPSRDIFLVKQSNALSPAVERFWTVAHDQFTTAEPAHEGALPLPAAIPVHQPARSAARR